MTTQNLVMLITSVVTGFWAIDMVTPSRSQTLLTNLISAVLLVFITIAMQLVELARVFFLVVLQSRKKDGGFVWAFNKEFDQLRRNAVRNGAWWTAEFYQGLFGQEAPDSSMQRSKARART